MANSNPKVSDRASNAITYPDGSLKMSGAWRLALDAADQRSQPGQTQPSAPEKSSESIEK